MEIYNFLHFGFYFSSQKYHWCRVGLLSYWISI